MRAHARRPDERVRRDPLAVRQHRSVGVESFERRAVADFYAAAGQLARGVLAELRRDLRQDRGRRVDEDPARRDLAQARVIAQGVAHEVRELCERFDACVAGSHEHERQVAARCTGFLPAVRQLQLAQHVVAKSDRVGEILEAVPVLREAGDGQGAAIGAECDDEPLVRDLERCRPPSPPSPPAVPLVERR